jgi:hypothetical protein
MEVYMDAKEDMAPFALGRIKKDDSIFGWIQCTSAECPIPWAKKGEYEVEWNGILQSWANNLDANEAYWGLGFKWRLTNRWIPILGGICPEQIKDAKAGEWEYRCRNVSVVGRPICDVRNFRPEYFGSCGTNTDIVAVRLIEQSVKTVSDYARGVTQPIVNGPSQTARVMCASIGQSKQETPQQRLTREAWMRYKAKHPDSIPFRPLGEEEMNGIAAAALREHDKIWPKRM